MAEIPAEYLATSRSIIPYEDRYDEICYWVDKRRNGWVLHDPSWEDVRAWLQWDIYRVYEQFDPQRGTFGQFANKVITTRLSNYWRDNYSSYAKPCVADGGCADNMGDNLCRRTPSGTQCAECPFYRDWEAKKGRQWAIRQTLPIENHANEAHTRRSTFVDYEGEVKRLNREMKKRLTRQEWKAYQLLVLKGWEGEDVAKALGFKRRRKRGQKKGMYQGYATILLYKKKFQEVAEELVVEMGLAA